MRVVAEGIENGKIPISDNGSDKAWDEDNPYRNLDSANKEFPDYKLNEEKPYELMNSAEKEIHNI